MITKLLDRAYNAIITRPDNESSGMMWTPGEANVRVPVRVSPQDSPDPIRQGRTPAREAKVPIVTFFHDTNLWSDWRFSQGQIVFGSPNADRPRGGQLPWRERVNIQSPQHQAYGSLFTSDAPVYGMGGPI